MIKNIKFANFKKEKVDDEIIDIKKLGYDDMYDYVAAELEKYIQTCDVEDRFYFASFDMKYKFDFGFEHMFEVIEVGGYISKDKHEIDYMIDWCEGETIIRKLNFYSESELEFVCKMLDEGGAVLI